MNVHALVWGSRFQVHHRVAERFRQGPLLLAGDAAHVHGPAGGQGMNTGILVGARRLAWCVLARPHPGALGALLGWWPH